MEPGGLWDADRYEIKARILRDGRSVGEIPLRYAGTTSQFEGSIDASEPGTYEVQVYAFDPSNGNTGLDRTTFLLE